MVKHLETLGYEGEIDLGIGYHVNDLGFGEYDVDFAIVVNSPSPVEQCLKEERKALVP